MHSEEQFDLITGTIIYKFVLVEIMAHGTVLQRFRWGLVISLESKILELLESIFLCVHVV